MSNTNAAVENDPEIKKKKEAIAKIAEFVPNIKNSVENAAKYYPRIYRNAQKAIYELMLETMENHFSERIESYYRELECRDKHLVKDENIINKIFKKKKTKVIPNQKKYPSQYECYMRHQNTAEFHKKTILENLKIYAQIDHSYANFLDKDNLQYRNVNQIPEEIVSKETQAEIYNQKISVESLDIFLNESFYFYQKRTFLEQFGSYTKIQIDNSTIDFTGLLYVLKELPKKIDLSEKAHESRDEFIKNMEHDTTTEVGVSELMLLNLDQLEEMALTAKRQVDFFSGHLDRIQKLDMVLATDKRDDKNKSSQKSFSKMTIEENCKYFSYSLSSIEKSEYGSIHEQEGFSRFIPEYRDTIKDPIMAQKLINRFKDNGLDAYSLPNSCAVALDLTGQKPEIDDGTIANQINDILSSDSDLYYSSKQVAMTPITARSGVLSKKDEPVFFNGWTQLLYKEGGVTDLRDKKAILLRVDENRITATEIIKQVDKIVAVIKKSVIQ